MKPSTNKMNPALVALLVPFALLAAIPLAAVAGAVTIWPPVRNILGLLLIMFILKHLWMAL
jgi:hypothetical protein